MSEFINKISKKINYKMLMSFVFCMSFANISFGTTEKPDSLQSIIEESGSLFRKLMVASEPYKLMVQEGYFDFHNKNQTNPSEVFLESELKAIEKESKKYGDVWRICFFMGGKGPELLRHLLESDYMRPAFTLELQQKLRKSVELLDKLFSKKGGLERQYCKVLRKILKQVDYKQTLKSLDEVLRNQPLSTEDQLPLSDSEEEEEELPRPEEDDSGHNDQKLPSLEEDGSGYNGRLAVGWH
jgi:hypothetical protein